jgi:hypothetical protein
MADRNVKWEAFESMGVCSNGRTREPFFTARLRVPGGWLVRALPAPGGVEITALTYVPDPSHEWQLDTDSEEKATC